MSLDLFLTFNGNCREAVAFYAKTFGLEMPKMMTMGEAPPDPQYPIPPEAKDLVMYTSLPIHGMNVMFCDNSPGMEFVVGTNISVTIGLNEETELRSLFDKLSAGGSVVMPPQKTFWSPCYSYLVDKFGIPWQLTIPTPM